MAKPGAQASNDDWPHAPAPGAARAVITALRCRWFGATDFERWANIRNHDPEWEKRTIKIAELIPPGTRVIEFGAGRRQLEKYLAPSCKYFPSDLVSRGPDTIVCDLNVRPLPDLCELNLDVAVLGGVMEYIADLRSFVAWLSRYVSLCIASYECASTRPGTLKRIVESLQRATVGWANTYTEEQIRAIFREFDHCGTFEFHEKDGDGQIFVFRRRELLPRSE